MFALKLLQEAYFKKVDLIVAHSSTHFSACKKFFHNDDHKIKICMPNLLKNK